jgi:hypothetical protein
MAVVHAAILPVSNHEYSVEVTSGMIPPGNNKVICIIEMKLEAEEQRL